MRAARSRPGSNSKSSSGVYLRPSDLPISRRMKPLALLKPAIAAGADTAFEVREIDVAVAQVVVHLDAGERDAAQARVAQVAHEQA